MTDSDNFKSRELWKLDIVRKNKDNNTDTEIMDLEMAVYGIMDGKGNQSMTPGINKG